MVLCENKNCLNHGPAGCKIAAIVIDCDGGCRSCSYSKGYWEKVEEETRKMITKEDNNEDHT